MPERVRRDPLRQTREIGGQMTDPVQLAWRHRTDLVLTGNADMILLLHHGEVAERGTHQQLLERGGLYSTLWRLQAGESESLLQRAG